MSEPLRVVPMKQPHVSACDAIAAVSEPWKTLNERIDFAGYLGRKEAFVIMDADTVAGFVIFTPEPVFARGGYLRAIGVAPDKRRQGIGAKLLAFAETVTARRSRYFYLCVSSFNRRAQAFYKRCGYSRIGAIPGLIVPDASEYIFWKRLPQSSHNARRIKRA